MQVCEPTYLNISITAMSHHLFPTYFSNVIPVSGFVSARLVFVGVKYYKIFRKCSQFQLILKICKQ